MRLQSVSSKRLVDTVVRPERGHREPSILASGAARCDENTISKCAQDRHLVLGDASVASNAWWWR